jgi:ATP-dependent RNA helicase DDX31/DBP7
LGSRNGAPDQNKNKGEHIRRQNLLLSATLNEKVNRLAKISLKNPVMIGLDDQKKPSGKSNRLGNRHTSLLSDDEDGILEKRNDILEHADAVDDFKLPAQLVQRYVKGSNKLLSLNFLKFMLVVCHLGDITKDCFYLVSCGSRLAVLLTILKSLFERQVSQKVSCILYPEAV